MDNSLKTKEKTPKRGANTPRKRQNQNLPYRNGNRGTGSHKRGPLLTGGSNDTPVEQAEDGRGEQTDQRPDHLL